MRQKSKWTIVTVEITSKECLELFGRLLRIQNSRRLFVVVYLNLLLGESVRQKSKWTIVTIEIASK